MTETFRIFWGPKFRSVFAAVAAIDLVLIVTNVVLKFLAFLQVIDAVPKVLQIGWEYSFGSFFNFTKWISACIILLCIWQKTRVFLYFVLAIIFLFLFLDDSLEIHEFIGGRLDQALALPVGFGLREQDIGELIVWVIFAAIAVPSLVFGVIVASQYDRVSGVAFFALLFVLGFFGIVMDMVHIIFGEIPGVIGTAIDFGLNIIEEGGEMIAGSALLALSYVLWTQVYRSPG